MAVFGGLTSLRVVFFLSVLCHLTAGSIPGGLAGPGKPAEPVEAPTVVPPPQAPPLFSLGTPNPPPPVTSDPPSVTSEPPPVIITTSSECVDCPACPAPTATHNSIKYNGGSITKSFAPVMTRLCVADAKQKSPSSSGDTLAHMLESAHKFCSDHMKAEVDEKGIEEVLPIAEGKTLVLSIRRDTTLGPQICEKVPRKLTMRDARGCSNE